MFGNPRSRHHVTYSAELKFYNLCESSEEQSLEIRRKSEHVVRHAVAIISFVCTCLVCRYEYVTAKDLELGLSFYSPVLLYVACGRNAWSSTLQHLGVLSLINETPAR